MFMKGFDVQTLTVQIKDSFMQEFLTFIKDKEENIYIKKDENLEQDPYFYERQRDLKQIIEDSESGKMELLSQKEYDSEMDLFFKNLKSDANI